MKGGRAVLVVRPLGFHRTYFFVVFFFPLNSSICAMNASVSDGGAFLHSGIGVHLGFLGSLNHLTARAEPEKRSAAATMEPRTIRKARIVNPRLVRDTEAQGSRIRSRMSGAILETRVRSSRSPCGKLCSARGAVVKRRDA